MAQIKIGAPVQYQAAYEGDVTSSINYGRIIAIFEPKREDTMPLALICQPLRYFSFGNPLYLRGVVTPEDKEALFRKENVNGPIYDDYSVSRIRKGLRGLPGHLEVDYFISDKIIKDGREIAIQEAKKFIAAYSAFLDGGSIPDAQEKMPQVFII